MRLTGSDDGKMTVAALPTILSDKGRRTFPDLVPSGLPRAAGKSGIPWHTFFASIGVISFLTSSDDIPPRLAVTHARVV